MNMGHRVHRPGARSSRGTGARSRGTGLGQAHMELNTRELRDIGDAVLDIAIPATIAAAEEALEEGQALEENDERPDVVSGAETGDGEFNVRDHFNEDHEVGIELVRELEARGYVLVRR